MAANRGGGNEFNSLCYLSCCQFTATVQSPQSREDLGIEMARYMKFRALKPRGDGSGEA
jgi:hypothetical protein